MDAMRLLARVELRRRWRAYLVIALLVGVVGGVVLTALAGARRTDSAFSRLRAETNESDVSLEASPEYFDAIEALPEVEAAAPGSFLFVMPADTEFENLLTIAGTDGRFGTVVNQPHLIDGRRPEPDRAEEVLVNTLVADRLGVGPGDPLTLVSFTPDQLEELIEGGDPGEPAGPIIDVVVTGIGETAEDIANRSSIMLFTPAFYTAYRDEIGHFDQILDVLLVDGDADVPTFRAGVERIVPPEEGAILETKAETTAEIEDATSVQSVALVAFAIVVGLAGFVAVGQALARQIGLSSPDQPMLQALGLPRRERSATLVVPAVVVALAGAVLAVLVAVLASPMMPTGFARRVDPDPGLHADWLVLGLGFVAIALVVSARAAFTAWRTAGRLHDVPAGTGAARIVSRVTRLGAPPPVVAGVRMALEPGRGRTAVPVRPALAGAVAGVAGLIAALTFGAGLGWVVTEPEAYGWKWDTGVVGPRESEALADDAAALAENGDTEGVAALSVIPIRLGGEPIQSYGLESVKGGGFVTVLEGRVPTGADEVLVGAHTLDRLDRQVGDTIDAEGLEGSQPSTLTIVGRGVFPEFVHPAVPDSDTGAYNEFALFSQAGSEAVTADAGGEFFSLVLIRWAPDVDRTAADAGLAEDGFELVSPALPSNLENVERVDAVPLLVGGFLALLAVVALTNALVTSVRRRARDFALLETLGFVGSQIRATVASQASVLAAIGLVLGIPAGLVLGRVAWTVVARGLGVDGHVPVPWLAVVLMIPATLVVANLLGALAARRAARTRPAVVLHSE